MVWGYQLDFNSHPPLRRPIRAHLALARDQTQAMEAEIESLLEKQAIVRLTPPLSPGFYSSVFVVPKKDGGYVSGALHWGGETAVTVVLAARGYPGEYETGSEIRNVEAAEELPGVTVCHAATERRNGALIAAGGRVLNVTAVGADAAEARARAYEAVDAIDWPQGFHRRDIGLRAGGRGA